MDVVVVEVDGDEDIREVDISLPWCIWVERSVARAGISHSSAVGICL